MRSSASTSPVRIASTAATLSSIRSLTRNQDLDSTHNGPLRHVHPGDFLILRAGDIRQLQKRPYAPVRARDGRIPKSVRIGRVPLHHTNSRTRDQHPADAALPCNYPRVDRVIEHITRYHAVQVDAAQARIFDGHRLPAPRPPLQLALKPGEVHAIEIRGHVDVRGR